MLGEADALNGIYVYEIDDRPGTRLCIGVPTGESRPAIWIMQNEKRAMLGRLNGPREMIVLVNFLDTFAFGIQRVIDHYKRLNGDQSNDIPY